ncbi:hypothetical protein EZI54_03020 [Marinobacter halodurans]|uniref:Lipoprotein n=1 Tax=Marinobacter halodurans TaxID=2528979 RepID=A0ABY1ZTE1_9GAMM|nr:hypothetical protein [Marinobacter halodurans]TBW58859.1 hypothetical protein EZI54_03020 [Marinobacter halodurans]
MRISRKFSKLFVLFFLFLNGCSDQESSKMYVPGPDFQQSLKITIAEDQVSVGNEILLTAERQSSGFVEVQEAETKGACSFTSKPPELETNVALNIQWIVEPSNASYEFSFSKAGDRTIAFARPGVYTIQARSSLWCPPGILSNKIVVEVSG